MNFEIRWLCRLTCVPQKDTFHFPTPRTFECAFIWKQAFANTVKMKSQSIRVDPNPTCPYKKKEIETQKPRENNMETYRQAEARDHSQVIMEDEWRDTAARHRTPGVPATARS